MMHYKSSTLDFTICDLITQEPKKSINSFINKQDVSTKRFIHLVL